MSPRSGHLHLDLTPECSLAAPARVELESVLYAMVECGYPVGFNVAVVSKTSTLFRAWGGYANVVGPPIETDRDTLYDLASLSKVVSTTTLALWLAQEKKWRLTDQVSKWLVDFPRADLTLRDLLTHTSGLIAHLPFFHLGRKPAAVRRAVVAETLNGGPRGPVLYSDLNFMLLGWAIEACSGQKLDELFNEVVAAPLDMTETRYRPGARLRSRVAATELNGDQRNVKEFIWGDVHDGNAWSLGGVAGHAGLFSTTRDLTLLVQSLLGASPRVLNSRGVASISAHPVGTAPEVRGLGWRLDPRAWGSWPADTMWHTGFTGTSLLVSPPLNLGVIVMTNAIHPARQLDRHEAMRSSLHEIVARYAH